MANQTDNTSSSVVPFLFDGDGLVRVVKCDGASWFVAADLARVLGFRDASNAVRNLDDDEKGTLNQSTPGGVQEHLIVSESGLYALILRSRKPAARRFRKWVTGEVLPAIRKTGGYRSPGRQGLSPEERAERSALASRRMRVNEVHAATRSLEALRRASGSRAAALAAPQIYAALGVNIDPDASDTLAQGELPLDNNTVH